MEIIELARLNDKVVNDIKLMSKLKGYKKIIQETLVNIILPNEKENLKNGVNDQGIVDSIIFIADVEYRFRTNQTLLDLFLISRACCEILKELEFKCYFKLEGQVKFIREFNEFNIKGDLEKKKWIERKTQYNENTIKNDFTEQFKEDIVENIRYRTDDYKKPYYPDDMVIEAKMYACCICLEFIEKSGFLSQDWIEHISNQVCIVMKSLFKEFTNVHRTSIMGDVLILIKQPNIKKIVSDYYKK